MESGKLLSLASARMRIAKLWFVFGTVLTLLLVAQTIFGKYKGLEQGVWSWALPNLMPTTSLIIGVLGTSALRSETTGEFVKPSFYAISKWMSIFYLSLIIITILIEPLTPFPPLELLNLSNLWLGPIQGLAVSAIGVLFLSTESKKG